MSREGLFYNKDKEQAYATFMYKENGVEIGYNEFAHSVTVKLTYENTDYEMFIIGPWGKVGGKDAAIEDVEQFLKQTKGFDALLATEKQANGTIGIEIPRLVHHRPPCTSIEKSRRNREGRMFVVWLTDSILFQGSWFHQKLMSRNPWRNSESRHFSRRKPTFSV